jgi:hypothetical protein
MPKVHTIHLRKFLIHRIQQLHTVIQFPFAGACVIWEERLIKSDDQRNGNAGINGREK